MHDALASIPSTARGNQKEQGLIFLFLLGFMWSLVGWSVFWELKASDPGSKKDKDLPHNDTHNGGKDTLL